MRRTPRVAIVGSGMSGICMGARLRMAGIDSFTIFEKGDRLGGTWRDNTYPGLTCDVPSWFYQFTFAPNPRWSHLFSPGAEIWEYFESVAERFRLRANTRFRTEVIEASYDDGEWAVTTADGVSQRFDFVLSATGVLHHPRYPDLDGLETFEGAVFHSARWDHDVPVEGRRVGVLGTGSTGVQIVCGLAGTASEVLLFQRTPQWVVTVPNPSTPRVVNLAHRLVKPLNLTTYATHRVVFELLAPALTAPGLRRQLVQRLARESLRRVKDPELRRRLTPDYEPMCKRLILSPSFYDVVQRDDVTLVDSGISQVTPGGILTRDGVEHDLDVLVLATGFDAHAYCRPMAVVGEHGLTLDDAWAKEPRAFKTVALPGFPNFFMFMGPNSPVGNYALTAIAENQAEHVMEWVGRWRAGAFDTVQPTQDATDDYNAEIREAMPGTVWMTGCDSWYLGADGVPELFPWSPQRHRRQLRELRSDDYVLTTTSKRRPRVPTPG